MPISSLRRIVFIAAATSIALSGCSTPQRFPAVPNASVARAETGLGPIRYFVTRETDSYQAEALRSAAKEKAWLASQGHSGAMPPASLLAISGGGDNGAYGAGFLNGWTAAGTRPTFKMVTGVSTGALIAPFAFLGPKYDYVLERVYTTSTQKDIFKTRGIIKGFFADGMADTTPLANQIAGYVNQPLLDEIAAEYDKGRLLVVATTNMDSLEPVIWNMTAIAASKDPRAIELFRKVLLASASIPGAFPPVMIDVTVDGTRYQEMHADGGTITQVFAYPPSLHIGELGAGIERIRKLYVLRNARLDADWSNVERRTLPIATRAIASLTRTQGIGDLYRMYATTHRDGIEFNLTYIPPTFNVPHREEFDTNYMQQLYALGKQLAQAGYEWEKYPPGFEHVHKTLSGKPGN